MTYATLLAALAAMLMAIPPLAAARGGVGLGFVISLAVLFAAALAASETPRMRRASIALLAVTLTAETLAWFVGTAVAVLVARTSTTVFLVYVASVVLRHVLGRERSTGDAVMGGLCVYLLLGVAFYSAFCILEFLSPGAFLESGAALPDVSGAVGPLGRYPDLLYYSFVTLTTLGYGDIVPVSPVARSLATAAAVVGQVYLAVLMAGLVGLHLAERTGR